MFLSDLSIKQPVLSTMLSVSLVVLGLYSYRRLSVDLFPDVEIPVLTVQTLYQGASPETVEREVTKRIEESLNTISGVRHIQSTTTEGLSLVMVEFRLGTNIHTAQQDAQAKINAIRADLPQDMEAPVIQRIDFNAMPIVSVAVESSTADIKALSSIAEKVIKKRLEIVPGVGEVKLVGLARREIGIYVDPEKLRSFGLTYAEVAAALRRDNLDMPAGKLDAGRQEPLIRVSGKVKSLDAFEGIIVAVRNGRSIYLPEVAHIVDGIEERRSAALIDGASGLAMDIVKQSGANTVEVADGIDQAIARVNAELPPHIRLRKVVDRAIFIRESVEDVQTTLIIGGLLTVLIVFLFLNSWRSTVITGLALPVSIISTFIIMHALGFTLNVLTLMGLSLAIGLLIDDAIVVRENIVRHMHSGQDHYTAARDATNEIGLAVMATTFTIIAVFVPVAFMGGIVGKFFYEFGITVGFAVLVSLYVSFTLDPMLSSRWYDPAADPTVKRSWFGRSLGWVNDQLDRLQGAMGGSLRWSLRHRWVVVLGATAAVVSSFFIFGQLGSAFMPESDQGDLRVTYKARPGISLETSAGIAREIIAELKKNPAIDYTYASIGGSGNSPVNEGSIYVKLTPRETRSHYLAIKDEIRNTLVKFRALRTAVSIPDDTAPDTKPVQVSLRGQDRARLLQLSDKLLADMRTVPGAVDVDTSEEPAREELQIHVNRAAASDLGLDVGSVASTMRGLVAGEVVSRFEDADGDSYDIRLRVDSAHRERSGHLLTLELPGQGGRTLIPVSQVASLEMGTAPSSIRRRDLAREIRLSANTAGRSLGEVMADVKAHAEKMDWPAGYGVSYTGEAEDMAETFGYVLEALALAIVLIYAILASQFRSFAQPFAIMLSLPLSLIGVAGMLYLVRDTLNMMSMIGVILLMGLVTKNAILVIDFANVERRRGKSRVDAVVSAAQVRLRPIIMTTLAMIFGMLPLAFELGAGAEFRAPMARAVVGGLITSTILTLLVVPVVYTYLDDVGAWLAKRWSAGNRRREHAHGAAPAGD